MSVWTFIAGITHLAGACAAAMLAVWLAGRRERLGTGGFPVVLALAMSAAWALAVAATHTESAGAALAESIRNQALLIVVWRLFRSDGRLALVKPVRPLVIVLAAAEVIQATMLIVLHRPLAGVFAQQQVFMTVVSVRLMMVIGALVLLHNLYGGASKQARLALRWPAASLALLWLFDLNLYTVAYLGQSWPAELAALRGVALVLAVVVLIPGMTKRRDELHFSPSRTVAFRFASLVTIGVYMAGMFLLARWLFSVDGQHAKLLQFGVLIAAISIALLALPSRRLRGWLKVVLVKHLFRHRYDYRAEWLRFAQIIGSGSATYGMGERPLEERAVQAVAQITDSPAGLLLTRGEHGDLVLAGHWQWRSPDVPASALDAIAVRYFEASGYIAELDEVRAGRSNRLSPDLLPAWLMRDPRAWALVPLRHYGRLTGLVVLARPPHERRLDWEDFDLLRVVGQQLATTLAERAGQEALAEAARFDEFNRRIAFVMHDIKNLASQFALLARNAEVHAENPAFRADMLVTLRNSTDKLNALIARLSRYGSAGGESVEEFNPCKILHALEKRFAGQHQVVVTQCEGCTVSASPEALEQALIHLVQNAIDASDKDAAVFLSMTSDGLHARIEVVDSGAGMSPEFIRTSLFRPFVSSKKGGFGIGACEARDLIRAMKGRLEVESREGLGTRFIIRLPLKATAGLISQYQQDNKRVA